MSGGLSPPLTAAMVAAETVATWTASCAVALDLKPPPAGMFEYACHEGNCAMRNMLSPARGEEAGSQSGGR